MASIGDSFNNMRHALTNAPRISSSSERGAFKRVGGYRNPHTGAGEVKGDGYFVPTRVNSRGYMEIMRVESWAANKFISIPVDDQFVEWREFNADKKIADAMIDAENRHQVKKKLAKAMKAGRLHGTGMLVMMTQDAPMNQPLDVETLRQGDLTNLMYFDRFDCNTYPDILIDPFDPYHGEPIEYEFIISHGNRIKVHPSRVLRFDGITPLTSTGWSRYTLHWGLSELIPVTLALLQDSSVASATSFLVGEASIPVIKMTSFRESLAAGGPEPDDLSPQELGMHMNELKSVYRTLFLDMEDEFMRVAVNFTGLPALMNEFAARLAAAADIPATRFWAQSPKGMNATGESDERNYALHVASKQEEQLTEPLRRLDAVLAKDAGLSEPPPYTFRSLIDLSDFDRAEIANKKVDAVYKGLLAGLFDADEGRLMVDGDEFFGNLDGPAPPEPVIQASRIDPAPKPDSPAT